MLGSPSLSFSILSAQQVPCHRPSHGSHQESAGTPDASPTPHGGCRGPRQGQQLYTPHPNPVGRVGSLRPGVAGIVTPQELAEATLWASSLWGTVSQVAGLPCSSSSFRPSPSPADTGSGAHPFSATLPAPCKTAPRPPLPCSHSAQACPPARHLQGLGCSPSYIPGCLGLPGLYVASPHPSPPSSRSSHSHLAPTPGLLRPSALPAACPQPQLSQ